MALSSATKKILIYSSIASAGALSYLMFKLGKKQEFIDNLWCGASDDCNGITPENYNQFSGGYSNASGDNDTGSVNLLFKEPHNLSAGEEILVTQTGDSSGNITFADYDGWHRVTDVVTPYIVTLNVARKGSSPVEGGYVQSESWWKRTF